MRIRLAVFTAISARELLCGKCALLFLWWTPHVFKNFSSFPDLNWGPSSEEYSFGTPNVIKYSRSLFIRASASNSPVPVSKKADPSRISISEDEIVVPCFMEIIAHYQLEWIFWWRGTDRWPCRLRWCISHACFAHAVLSTDVFSYPWPKYRLLCSIGHTCDSLVGGV